MGHAAFLRQAAFLEFQARLICFQGPHPGARGRSTARGCPGQGEGGLCVAAAVGTDAVQQTAHQIKKEQYPCPHTYLLIYVYVHTCSWVCSICRYLCIQIFLYVYVNACAQLHKYIHIIFHRGRERERESYKYEAG